MGDGTAKLDSAFEEESAVPCQYGLCDGSGYVEHSQFDEVSMVKCVCQEEREAELRENE